MKGAGLVARFADPSDLLAAARSVREQGYDRVDAYTPFPVHGLAEVLKAEDPRLPWLIFACGAVGALLGYGLQYYVSVIAYPLNVGGRPLHSWPAFIPVTFETTVLLAAFGAVIGMFALNGLPQPHHPVFDVPGFERASTDAFFLEISASDKQYDRVRTADLLRSLGALEVYEVGG